MVLVQAQQEPGPSQSIHVSSPESGSTRQIPGSKKSVPEDAQDERRQSFNAYLEETSESKDTKKFYDMMKRLSQKFKWKVNVGCDREDEIARQLASLASDSAYTDLEQEIEEERQTPEARARSVDPEYFSVLDWSIVMKSLKTRKSPGPDSMTYENWRSLDPKLTPFLVKAFSETVTSGNFDPEWFRF